MAIPTINCIELFSGVGMLGEGLRAGLDYMGIAYRTVCHVEREAYAASVLVARMEEKSMDAAPVWSDVTTFDARKWRGKVDCVVAGFPCQDLSVAGRRAGLDGARSGLFFQVTRIAEDCGAWCIVLENVAGIATATATVVDEEEGELEERAVARVLGELADLGWDAEWLPLSASDVGARHGRARWFCFAWRTVVDAERAERREVSSTGVGGKQGDDAGRPEADGRPRKPIEVLGDAQRTRRQASGSGHTQHARGEPEPGCVSLGHPGLQHQHLQQWTEGSEHPRAGDELGHAASARCSRRENAGASRAHEATGPRSEESERGSVPVADADGIRRRKESDGKLESSGTDWGCIPFFAPGPNSSEWEWIISTSPWLAPALEPDFRGMVDGMAFAMDQSRAQRLKCVGNGVVALQAACAFVVLFRRAGVLTVETSQRRAA